MLPLLLLLTFQQPPTEVDPMDLDRRPELVGRELVVDGRVALFLNPDRGFDEIDLKESDVVYRLPPELRFRQAPRERVVRMQGTLKREGDLLVFDVRSLQLLPGDLERIERALRPLAPGELTTRSAWSRWATHRAKIYNDPDLAERARQLQAEVLRIQASRPDARSPEATLALARAARDQQVPEPAPSALAHRAFHQRFREARTSDALDTLAAEVDAFLSSSKVPQVAAPPNLRDWSARYSDDPETTYVQAPPDVRAALDRQLLGDILERRLRDQAGANPRQALDLVNQARARLPDRPAVADQIRAQGLKARADDVTALRRAEVLDLARQFEQDGKPEQARAIKRAWLDHQRNSKLDRNDATSRRNLAELYLSWVGDKTTAVELLQEALRLDPKFDKAIESLRRLGYRKDGDTWVEFSAARQAAGPEGSSAASAQDDPLLNLTPDEVITQLGKPDRRSITITQGTVLVQWVYQGTGRKIQIVNFRKTSDPTPRVIARYATP